MKRHKWRKRWLAIRWYIRYIIQDFSQPVLSLIPAIFVSTCVIFVISRLCEKRGVSEKKCIRSRVIWTLFLAYILVVFHTTFFSREAGSRKTVSLILFETWGRSFHMHAMFIENIIMFIPFGVFLPTLFERFRNWRLCVLTGFCVPAALRFRSISPRGDICSWMMWWQIQSEHCLDEHSMEGGAALAWKSCTGLIRESSPCCLRAAAGSRIGRFHLHPSVFPFR